jgi:hypothetical protein
MPEKNVFSLSPILSSSRSKPSIEEVIAKAMQIDATRNPAPRAKYVTIHFRLLKGKRGVPKARLIWLDKDGKPIKVDGTLRTNEVGRGMVCIDETVFRGLDSLRLDVTLKDKVITFHNIKVDTTSEKVTLSGPKGLALEIAAPSEPPMVTPLKNKRTRRFSVAVCGKPAQLRTAIPLLKGRACFHMKAVFVDGKANKQTLALCKGMTVAKIDGNMPKRLERIELLIDLSNNSLIRRLVKAQLAGTGKLKTIIVPDAAKFLGMKERILSYYERPIDQTLELAKACINAVKKTK